MHEQLEDGAGLGEALVEESVAAAAPSRASVGVRPDEDRHLRAHHRRPSLLVLVLSQTCALPRGTGPQIIPNTLTSTLDWRALLVLIISTSISGNFGFEPCSHGDFLGAILGTGIVREKLGDIILQGEKGAHVLVVPELVDFLTTTLDKDRYLQLEDQASQTQEVYVSLTVDKVALFYEAAGGEKKHRVYGTGSQKSVFYPQSSCSSSTGASSMELQARITQLENNNKELQESTLAMQDGER
ncbi:hypothetical protein J5N97_004355 [Dioscorea zingiberensis]|uniref:Ribosome-associated protein quality control protein P2 RNA-binding domain-containing protein n=1 Tax=Dioscorea zingiberensis TaxID=325984 RepID=A0A9D5HRA7_9LILI|nr:hypothetical protein J5N97_004355 [Dioscorea zingiberensis]